ncbi:MAG: type II toxin-antitoxin system HicA family toxin [Elusimicrobia bacterium]|nr:type II toxin-antitoxin system HicA family toxin [Elusimicrobiota bacterium]
MSDLPQVPGHRLIRALEKAGFVVLRQRGSHVLLRHREDFTRRATVLLHGSKPIKPGTLQAILRGTKLTVEELRRLL